MSINTNRPHQILFKYISEKVLKFQGVFSTFSKVVQVQSRRGRNLPHPPVSMGLNVVLVYMSLVLFCLYQERISECDKSFLSTVRPSSDAELFMSRT